MSRSEVIQPVFSTLAIRDPNKTTICVGGAAMAVHLAEAGDTVERQVDVDVLCSKAYFTEQSSRLHLLENVDKCQIRWPYGDESVRALSPVLDIYPATSDSSLLPFSACEALGGIWHPTYYEDCIANSSQLVTYRGYHFLSMFRLLLWTAISGRDKDFIKVETLTPVAYKLELITTEELRNIMHEKDTSLALKAKYPDRHHARVG